ncbi:hypothetical protein LPJ66_002187 [Kickxella alabastrina]|uniref:Uncharacterized protein n=1 Tax=Kickxella alabastrina TaxID=61397 RepID=A0ACC1IR48_9FUNG|nr:hypothetical protein LPJ66_002187 [Kickxella alabastrina]
MDLDKSSFKIGSTVILAYPDVTRLAGYRAALGLWDQLTATNTEPAVTSTVCFESKVEEILQAHDFEEIDTPASAATTATGANNETDAVNIVFANAQSNLDLTFCFVNGLPEQKRVPELVDSLIGLLEKHSVKTLVIPAAVNLAGIKVDDKLWAYYPSELPIGCVELEKRLSGVQKLPGQGAQTNDVFLSVLSNLVSVSGISEAVVLVHGDKRPSGSAYRQKATFGSDYVDESDSSVVKALSALLATAVGAAEPTGEHAVEVEVTRMRLDVESAALGLPAFG